jgi:hypothetical protein
MPEEDAERFRQTVFGVFEATYGEKISDSVLERLEEEDLAQLERLVAKMLGYPGYALN